MTINNNTRVVRACNPGKGKKCCKNYFHPLTLGSDLNLISPYNITPRISKKGHENKGKDHQLKKLLIRNGLVLLWFKDLMNATVKSQFLDPMFQHSCPVPPSEAILIVKQILLVSTLGNV